MVETIVSTAFDVKIAILSGIIRNLNWFGPFLRLSRTEEKGYVKEQDD